MHDVEETGDGELSGEPSDVEKAAIAQCILQLKNCNQFNHMQFYLSGLLHAWEQTHDDHNDYGGHLARWLYDNQFASPNIELFSDFTDDNRTRWTALIGAVKKLHGFFIHGQGEVVDNMPQQAAGYIQRAIIDLFQDVSFDDTFIVNWNYDQALTCLRHINEISQMPQQDIEALVQRSLVAGNDQKSVKHNGPGRPAKSVDINKYLESNPLTTIPGTKGKNPTIKQWARAIRDMAIEQYKKINPSADRREAPAPRTTEDMLSEKWMRDGEQYDDQRQAWTTRWKRKAGPAK
jgi:hypothetical protein